MLSSRTSRLALLTVVGVVLAAASMPTPASAAAQRHASPSGSGSDCTSATPCSITRAVNHATTGAEVIVKPGTYPLTATLVTPAPITIHGVAGKPRPRLLFSGASQEGLRVYSSTLRYVAVEQAPGTDRPALYAGGSWVDQVIAKATGATETAAIQNSTIRNSIVVASGPMRAAIATEVSGATGTSAYRNVTAMSTGLGGVAIRVRAGFAPANATVNLVNVIARGAGTDLEARTDSSGAQATITATRTNYQSGFESGTGAAIIDGGGNQISSPVFVNPFTGDYRQAAGSPTIGAGLDQPIDGELDVDGDPRRIGTTDIGADEFVVAPAATTGPAGAIAAKSATLTGSVGPNGGPTTYRFEYGPTTAYGSTTAKSSAGSGIGTVPASRVLTGLNPGTTYHFRLVATNSGGVTRGADRTFTTAP